MIQHPFQLVAFKGTDTLRFGESSEKVILALGEPDQVRELKNPFQVSLQPTQDEKVLLYQGKGGDLELRFSGGNKPLLRGGE